MDRAFNSTVKLFILRYFSGMVFPTGMGTIEISIRICLFFSDTQVGLYRGSAKDVSNSQKGKPRRDSRKQLPESVRRSNQSSKGAVGALSSIKAGSLS